MTESAILSLRRGSNNIPALRKIAETMYVMGDLQFASRLINLSMDNALEYNSKHRIVESAKGYPIIETQLQTELKSREKSLHIITIVLCVVIILLVLSAVMILKTAP